MSIRSHTHSFRFDDIGHNRQPRKARSYRSGSLKKTKVRSDNIQGFKSVPYLPNETNPQKKKRKFEN